MELEAFAELVAAFTEEFPPKEEKYTLPVPGRPGTWLLDRQSPAIVAVALGYSSEAPLKRFLQMVDTRSALDTYEWSLNHRRAWAKNNHELLDPDESREWLRVSAPAGKSRREPEIASTWDRLIQSYDWGRVGLWGPGHQPVGQMWRLERLQLLYVVAATLSYSLGDHLAQLFLLGKNPRLGTAPLQVIADSGRGEAEAVLAALGLLIRLSYPAPDSVR